MGFELGFRARGGAGLAREDFDAWFAARPSWTLADGGARYENEDSTIYLEVVHGDADRRDELGGPARAAIFRVDVLRSRPFALEAAPEIRAFVERFGLLVDDLQAGIEAARFDAPAFVASWAATNRRALRAVLADPGPDRIVLHARSAAKLKAEWRWNGARARRLARGETAHVAPIFYGACDDERFSCAAWSNAEPIVLPRVDRVLLESDRFGTIVDRLRERGEQRWLEHAKLPEAVRRCPERSGPVPSRRIAFADPPRELIDAFRRSPRLPNTFLAVGLDAFVEAEELAAARRGT